MAITDPSTWAGSGGQTLSDLEIILEHVAGIGGAILVVWGGSVLVSFVRYAIQMRSFLVARREAWEKAVYSGGPDNVVDRFGAIARHFRTEKVTFSEPTLPTKKLIDILKAARG